MQAKFSCSYSSGKEAVWTLKEILNVTVVQNVQVFFFFKRSEKMHKKSVQSKFKIKFFEK